MFGLFELKKTERKLEKIEIQAGTVLTAGKYHS